jgi:hypothetical protein
VPSASDLAGQRRPGRADGRPCRRGCRRRRRHLPWRHCPNLETERRPRRSPLEWTWGTSAVSLRPCQGSRHRGRRRRPRTERAPPRSTRSLGADQNFRNLQHPSWLLHFLPPRHESTKKPQFKRLTRHVAIHPSRNSPENVVLLGSTLPRQRKAPCGVNRTSSRRRARRRRAPVVVLEPAGNAPVHRRSR